MRMNDVHTTSCRFSKEMSRSCSVCSREFQYTSAKLNLKIQPLSFCISNLVMTRDRGRGERWKESGREGEGREGRKTYHLSL